MKVWEIDKFGMEHLTRRDISRGQPGPGELLVKVGAVSLNYRDKLVIDGDPLPKRPDLPFVPVSDFCGEVVEVGRDVSRFNIGDRVIGNFWTEWLDDPFPDDLVERGQTLGGPLPGALVEYIVVPDTVAVAAPDNLSDIEACTLPVAALTAWSALAHGKVDRDNYTVLVQGTGGVALAALQIAQALGARVIVTSRSASKLDRVLADHAAWAGINTSDVPDWAEKAFSLTNGRGVDHILELIGGENVDISAQALAPEGQISMIGILGGTDLRFSAVPFMVRHARLQGISVGHRRGLEQLVAFIEAKKIHPVIDQVYGFDDVPAAFSHLSRGAFGKVVVQMDNQSEQDK